MSVHGPLAAPPGGAFELRSTGARAQEASARDRRTVVGYLGLAGLFVTGLVVSISAAGTNALLPESVRPIPRWLAGPFGSTGIDIRGYGVIAVLIVMFAAYIVTVQAADRLSARAVLTCIAALYALVLLAPPLFSTDVFSYQAYARMGVLYGTNPYLNGPHAIALDPLYPFIGAKWVTTPTVYGPLFTLLSYALTPLSIAPAILAYKAIAAIAGLVTVALVWNAARLRGVNQVKAVALFGLNPLVVLYGVGGGHNDLLMLALLLAGVVLLLSKRATSSGATIAIATGVKLTAGVFLPFALAAAGRPLGGNKRRDLLIGAGVTSVCLVVLSIAMFGIGTFHLPGNLALVQGKGDWHSIPGFIGTELGLGGVGHVVGVLLGVVFIGVFCRLVWRVWRGELDWIVGAGWAAVALLVTASSLLPWYAAWLIPFAALGRSQRLWKTSLVITGVILAINLVGFIPNGTNLF